MKPGKLPPLGTIPKACSGQGVFISALESARAKKHGVVIARLNGRGVFSFALPNLPESVPEGVPRCSCWLPNLLVICQGPPERALTKLHNEARMKRENDNEARMKQAKNARTKQLPPPIFRKTAKRAGELLFFMCLVFGSCSFCRGAAVVIRRLTPGFYAPLPVSLRGKGLPLAGLPELFIFAR